MRIYILLEVDGLQFILDVEPVVDRSGMFVDGNVCSHYLNMTNNV